MSASPDDTSFLQGLLGPNGSVNQNMYNPLMGLAIGLLQAGGPSRMPVSLGQALGQGLQTGQQFQGAGLQNAMAQLQLKQALQGQQYFNQFLGGQQQSNASSQAAPQPASTQTAPSGKPTLPQILDPTQDPQYLDLMRQSQIAAYYKMDPQPLIARANARLDQLKSQEVTLTPDQAKILVPGVEPGMAIKFKPYSGDWSTAGTSLIKTTTDPVTGQQVLMNVETGKPLFATTARAPGDPLPGPYESIAKQVANYDVKPPNSGSGRGAVYASNILARAQEINPDFNAQNYDTSLKAAKDFSTGKQGQGVKSFNVALKHLDTLSQLSTALSNGDIPAVNKIANVYKTQTGGAAPTSFNAAKQIVGDEIVKAIVGSGGGVHDRETAAATINAASSPAQLKQVIETYKQLMVGQLQGLQQQYEQTTFRKDFDKFLSPEALKVMQTEGGQAPQTGQTLTYDPSTGTFK